MGEVFTLGKMEEGMRVSTTMIKNRDMVYMFGLMDASMQDNGEMENNMEKENIVYPLDKKELVSGRKVKD